MASQRANTSTSAELNGDTDGRVLRGERTRVLIVSAILELLREGVIQPTAERVAARANVGVRTVFRHFDAMESLYAAVNGALFEEIRPYLSPESGPFPGDTEQRVRELVRRLDMIYERVAPARRVSFDGASSSTEVRRGLGQFNRLMADQVRVALAKEIQGRAPALREAVEAVLSFEYWDRLRRVQRVGKNRVAAIRAHNVLLLLADRSKFWEKS